MPIIILIKYMSVQHVVPYYKNTHILIDIFFSTKKTSVYKIPSKCGLIKSFVLVRSL